MARTPADRTRFLLTARAELRRIRDEAVAAAEATYRAGLAGLAEEALDLAAEAHQLDEREPEPVKPTTRRKSAAPRQEPAAVLPERAAELLALPIPALKERIAGVTRATIEALRAAEVAGQNRAPYLITLDAAIKAAA